MHSKTRFDYVAKLPPFLQRAFRLRYPESFDYDLKFRLISSFPRRRYYTTTIGEEYMYLQLNNCVFSDIYLYRNTTPAYRMFSLCYGEAVIVVDPDNRSVAFFSADTYTNDHVVDFEDTAKWSAITQEDIALLGIDENNFIKYDFEDFIFKNKNLTEENIAYLFMKYS